VTLVAESLDLGRVIVGVLKAGCDLDAPEGQREFVRRHLSESERELGLWVADGVPEYVMAAWLRIDVRNVRRRIVALEVTLADYGLCIRVAKGPPQRNIRPYNPLGLRFGRRVLVRHSGGFRRIF
jgi:hypothetical protein